MSVVIRCTVGAASEGLMGESFGQVLFNYVAIEAVYQLNLGLGIDLGRGYLSAGSPQRTSSTGSGIWPT